MKETKKKRKIELKTGIAKRLLEFLGNSPTPYHAVDNQIQALEASGFTILHEGDPWKLKQGGKYYVHRGDGSLVAFRLGTQPLVEKGFRIVGVHSDSPALKIKPQPELSAHGYITLGVEVYGGAILHTWFDRDLSVAGKITYLGADNLPHSCLINFQHPLAFIPNLAIHLTQKSGKKSEINKQLELPPIISIDSELEQGSKPTFDEIIAKQVVQESSPKIKVKKVLGHDLFLYDTQPAALVGYQKEFINGGKLDNLLSCHVGLEAFLGSTGEATSVYTCYNHEEVGSQSKAGAASSFLSTVLNRIAGGQEEFYRAISHSTLLSVDNAHSIHPNYPERHDLSHAPIINSGPVIKNNANQRYATQNETAGFFQWLCQQVDVPVQNFVNRSDLGCGSTIGPIASTTLGIQALDIGVATLAMHSIRETCGVKDLDYLYLALKQFFQTA